MSLEVLSLDGNKLEELPIEICWLPNLRELRVCNNNLHSLPLEIGLLQQINKIFLSQNKIKELPEVICYMILENLLSSTSFFINVIVYYRKI